MAAKVVMALDLTDGFNPANLPAANDHDLPIFTVEPAQLGFSVTADFVAAQVANDVMVLALSNGMIIRIDLRRPEDIDGASMLHAMVTPPACAFLTFSRQILSSPRRHRKSASFDECFWTRLRRIYLSAHPSARITTCTHNRDSHDLWGDYAAYRSKVWRGTRRCPRLLLVRF